MEKPRTADWGSDPGLGEEVGLLLIEMLLLGLVLEGLARFPIADLGAECIFQEFAGQQTVSASVALGLNGRLTRG